MHTIRYKKYEFNDNDQINQFLSIARTGCLGLTDGENPYVVPLNFVWMNNSLYFHGAEQGRKFDLMQANPNCCFTIYEEYGTTVDPIPANTGTAYMSVMLFGVLEEVHDLKEATAAMQAMLDKYVPGYYDKKLPQAHVEKYRSSLGSRTITFKLTPKEWTAKKTPLNSEMIFYQGRTIKDDL